MADSTPPFLEVLDDSEPTYFHTVVDGAPVASVKIPLLYEILPWDSPYSCFDMICHADCLNDAMRRRRSRQALSREELRERLDRLATSVFQGLRNGRNPTLPPLEMDTVVGDPGIWVKRGSLGEHHRHGQYILGARTVCALLLARLYNNVYPRERHFDIAIKVIMHNVVQSLYPPREVETPELRRVDAFFRVCHEERSLLQVKAWLHQTYNPRPMEMLHYSTEEESSSDEEDEDFEERCFLIIGHYLDPSPEFDRIREYCRQHRRGTPRDTVDAAFMNFHYDYDHAFVIRVMTKLNAIGYAEAMLTAHELLFRRIHDREDDNIGLLSRYELMIEKFHEAIRPPDLPPEIAAPFEVQQDAWDEGEDDEPEPEGMRAKILAWWKSSKTVVEDPAGFYQTAVVPLLQGAHQKIQTLIGRIWEIAKMVGSGIKRVAKKLVRILEDFIGPMPFDRVKILKNWADVLAYIFSTTKTGLFAAAGFFVFCFVAVLVVVGMFSRWIYLGLRRVFRAVYTSITGLSSESWDAITVPADVHEKIVRVASQFQRERYVPTIVREMIEVEFEDRAERLACVEQVLRDTQCRPESFNTYLNAFRKWHDYQQVTDKFVNISEGRDMIVNTGFEAHPPAPLYEIVSIVLGCLTLGTASKEEILRVTSTIRALTGAMQVKKLVAAPWMWFLSYCPAAVKIYAGYKDMTVVERKATQHYMMAMSAIANQRHPVVHRTEEYKQIIDETIKQGHDLVFNEEGLTPAQLREIHSLHQRLINIKTVYDIQSQGTKPRYRPFAVHMAGEPGVGKSTAIASILKDAMGIGRELTYHVPINTNFWNGSFMMDAVVIDEFLSFPDKDPGDTKASDYMNLVGSAPFFPDQAGLDNMSTGLSKGTPICPKAVFTMSNYLYPVSEKIGHGTVVHKALLRRRDITVLVQCDSAFYDDVNQCVDVAALSRQPQEFLDDMKHLTFTVVDNIVNTRGRGVLMTYPVFVQYVKDRYEAHRMFEMARFDGVPVFQREDLMEGFEREIAAIKDNFPMVANTGSDSGIELQDMGPNRSASPPPEEVIPKGWSLTKFMTRISDICASIKSTLTRENVVTCTLNIFHRMCSEWMLALVIALRTVLIFVAIAGVLHCLSLVGAVFGISLGAFLTAQCTNSPNDRWGKINPHRHERKQMKSDKISRVDWADMYYNSGRDVTGNVLHIMYEGRGKQYALGIKDRLYLVNKHFFEMESNFQREKFHAFINGDWSRINNVEVYTSEMTDLAVLDLSGTPHLKLCRDISKSFLSGLTHDDMTGIKAEVRIGDSNYVFDTKQAHDVKVISPNGGYTTVIPFGLQYMSRLSYGHCGLPLIVNEGPSTGKILGVHCASVDRNSGSGLGTAVFVSSEWLASTLQQVSELKPIVDEEQVTNSGKSNFYKVTGPNVIGECIKADREIYVSTKSKLKRAPVSLWVNQKLPAPMSRVVDGKWVMHTMVDELAAPNFPDPDKRILSNVVHELVAHLTTLIGFPIKRILTQKEAIMGIKGTVDGMNLASSIGFPFAVSGKTTKRDYIKIDHEAETVEIDRDVALLCQQYGNYLENGGPNIDLRMAMFLKDELLPIAKVNRNRVRITACSPFPFFLYGRMMTMPVQMALVNAWREGPYIIGLNPHSLDFDSVVQSLNQINNKVFCGDGKSWDKNLHYTFQRAALEVILILSKEAIPNFPERMFRRWCDDLMSMPNQYQQNMFILKHGQRSGNPITTIMNCICHDLMWRYVFMKVAPRGTRFDEHVKAKFCGDDNIVAVSKNALAYFNDIVYSNHIGQLGQIYTAADKESQLTGVPVPILEATFLGGSIKLDEELGVHYVALDKDTIEELPLWVQKSDLTYSERLKFSLEHASLWGQQYYETFRARLCNGVPRRYEVPEMRMPWKTMRHMMLHRVCVDPFNSSNRVFFFNTGNEGETPPAGPMGASRDAFLSLVKLDDAVDYPPSNAFPYPWDVTDRVRSSMSYAPMDQNTGLMTDFLRSTFIWNSGDADGATIASYELPYDLVDTINPCDVSLQNMPWNNMIYFTGNICLKFQLSGSPFQSGALMFAFYPLPQGSFLANNARMFQCQHFIAVPANAGKYTMNIPFRHYRNALNIFAKGEVDESLGTLVVKVLDPLNTDSVTVNMFSRFPNSQFRIPKPNGFALKQRSASAVEKIQTFTFNQERVRKVGIVTPSSQVLNGASNSKTTVNNYEISNSIVGDASAEVQDQGSMDATGAEVGMEIPMLPLDKPLMSGGGIPTFSQQPGMARAGGATSCQTLQLKPASLLAHKRDVFGCPGDESNLGYLSRFPGIHGVYPWSTSDVTGTVLLSMPVCPDPKGAIGELNGTNIPMSVCSRIATYWRGNITLHFTVFSTTFHRGVFQAVMAYGAPGIPTFTDAPAQINKACNITGGKTEFSFTIPYNAQSPWLVAPDLVARYNDTVQQHLLGYCVVYVLNPLVAAGTSAATTVKILVSMNGEMQFAVPRPLAFATMNNLITIADPTALRRQDQIVNTGDDENAGTTDKEATSADSQDVQVGETTQRSRKKDHDTPGKESKIHKKTMPTSVRTVDRFDSVPHPISSVVEIARRYRPFPYTGSDTWTRMVSTELDVLVLSFEIRPVNIIGSQLFTEAFAGWRGGCHVRFFRGEAAKDMKGTCVAGFWPGEAYSAITQQSISMWAAAMSSNMYGEEFTCTNPASGVSWKITHSQDSIVGCGYIGVVEATAPTDEVYADYHIPYQHIYPFLPTVGNYNSLGTFIFVVSTNATDRLTRTTMLRRYICAADDFRLGMFRGFEPTQTGPGGLDTSNYTPTVSTVMGSRLFTPL